MNSSVKVGCYDIAFSSNKTITLPAVASSNQKTIHISNLSPDEPLEVMAFFQAYDRSGIPLYDERGEEIKVLAKILTIPAGSNSVYVFHQNRFSDWVLE